METTFTASAFALIFGVGAPQQEPPAPRKPAVVARFQPLPQRAVVPFVAPEPAVVPTVELPRIEARPEFAPALPYRMAESLPVVQVEWPSDVKAPFASNVRPAMPLPDVRTPVVRAPFASSTPRIATPEPSTPQAVTLPAPIGDPSDYYRI